MFIAFEGLDGSGKTTLSRLLSKSLDFIRTRNPTFSSEEADRLNLKALSSEEREAAFLMDHVSHQAYIREHENLICDRYVWTAQAYSRVYSSEIHGFLNTVYTNDFFRKPDAYVFVDTPIEICLTRKQDQPLGHLRLLHDAYMDTWPDKTKVIILTADGSPQKAYQELVNQLLKALPGIFPNTVQEDLFTS